MRLGLLILAVLAVGAVVPATAAAAGDGGGLHPPRETAVISGHRDWLATECPGERLYSQLPALREAVAEQLAFDEAG